jgi:peptidoglycan-associated lipoprotein
MGRTVWTPVLCVLLMWSTACGKKPLQTMSTPVASPPGLDGAPSAPPPPPPPTPEVAPTPSVIAESEEDIFSRKTVDQLNAEGVLGHVFFDLDQAALRDADRVTLQRNADWLRRWSSTRIAIEGHCDSRGTAEYNLALGNRRAVAVRDYLVSLGVPTDRASVVSKGKEQPFCHDETEECWQMNRRGHFVIVDK